MGEMGEGTHSIIRAWRISWTVPCQGPMSMDRKRWTRLSNQTTSTTLLRGIDFHGSLTAHRVARGEGCSSLNLSDIVWGQLEFLFSNKSNNKQQHCKQEESFLSHLENVCN